VKPLKQPEIDARRQALAKKFLSLSDAWSSRGLELCEEFGRLAEEEAHLQCTADAAQTYQGQK
jgi:hypothetical protein